MASEIMPPQRSSHNKGKGVEPRHSPGTSDSVQQARASGKLAATLDPDGPGGSRRENEIQPLDNGLVDVSDQGWSVHARQA
jgi:hypothetical protein